MSEQDVQRLLAEEFTIVCVCTDDQCFCLRNIKADAATLRAIIAHDPDYVAPCPDCAAGRHVYLS